MGYGGCQFVCDCGVCTLSVCNISSYVSSVEFLCRVQYMSTSTVLVVCTYFLLTYHGSMVALWGNCPE